MEFDLSRFEGVTPEHQKLMREVMEKIAARRRLWPDTIEEEERRRDLLKKDPVYAGLKTRYEQEGLSESEQDERHSQVLDRMKEIMTSPTPVNLVAQATDNPSVK